VIVLLALISITTTGALSTCGGPGRSASVLPRTLPERPNWARPVVAQRPADGTDWQEVAGVLDNANQANSSRLIRFGQWYDERRVEYGATK